MHKLCSMVLEAPSWKANRISHLPTAAPCATLPGLSWGPRSLHCGCCFPEDPLEEEILQTVSPGPCSLIRHQLLLLAVPSGWLHAFLPSGSSTPGKHVSTLGLSPATGTALRISFTRISRAVNCLGW